MAHAAVLPDQLIDHWRDMQAVLLRFLDRTDRLQSKADVRVIAATNRDLAERVGERDSRAELYYRLT